MFNGFKGQAEMVNVPSEFFTELVPLVDDLAELKVLLFCFWALPQKDVRFNYLRRRDFAAHQPLMDGLATIDADTGAVLDSALQKAVRRGALLCVTVNAETLYFVNTQKGRTAVAQIKAGETRPGDSANPVEILPPRPTIYRLYEENIGALTPIIADELKDMAGTFPTAWIEEAIKLAVEANKRSLRYVRAILKRWKTEGKDDGETTGRSAKEDERRYVSGKYADFIDH